MKHSETAGTQGMILKHSETLPGNRETFFHKPASRGLGGNYTKAWLIRRGAPPVSNAPAGAIVFTYRRSRRKRKLSAAGGRSQISFRSATRVRGLIHLASSVSMKPTAKLFDSLPASPFTSRATAKPLISMLQTAQLAKFLVRLPWGHRFAIHEKIRQKTSKPSQSWYQWYGKPKARLKEPKKHPHPPCSI
jgi:hypothetical protein